MTKIIIVLIYFQIQKKKIISKLLLVAGNDNVEDKKKINFVKNYLLEYSKNLEIETNFFKGCKNHNFIYELIQKGEFNLLEIYKKLINQSV